tara:strand:- start:1222 stop:1503 length:282 start_codon:yes stop_codon:yes gene_type:complete
MTKTTKNKITFEFAGTDDSCSEWYVDLNGEAVATMYRERPTRWHGNGVSGLVRAHELPYTYSVVAWKGASISVEIPDGTNLRTAKKLIIDALS